MKKESLPVDLVKIMDVLMGGKKKKKDKGEDDVEDDGKSTHKGNNEDKEIKEDAMTQIKRDYLSLDFKIFVNVSDILLELK